MISKRVLAIHSAKREGDPGPCEIYRITTPLYYLNKAAGWECQWMSFTEFYQRYLHSQDAETILKALSKEFDLFVWARTVIFPKELAFKDGAKTLSLLRSHGAKHIYEVDDDYTNMHRKVVDGATMSFASWCDAATVTTPILADTMRRQINKPVHIIPNMLDPMLWKAPPRVRLDDQYIRIVLSGSKTHQEDWKPLEGVLHRIGAEFPNVKVMIGGWDESSFPYLKNIPNAEYIPAMPYVYYIDLIKNADIVLAPVDPNDRFNDHKSPIKVTEGQGAGRLLNDEIVGAACIATNNAVYPLGIQNEKVGMLVEHTSEAWEKAIRELIVNTEKRQQMQRDAYNFVWKKFNLETGWMEWARAYSKVIAAPRKDNASIDYSKSFAAYRKSVGLPNGIEGQP